MKIKKIAAVSAIAAISAVSLVGCGSSTSTDAAGTYTPGTYTATAQGMGADGVTVNLTFDAETITDAECIGDSETPGIGGLEACQDGTYAAQIIEAQSADIDGVSGATITSTAVMDATTDAIAQAKGESAAE